MRDRVEGKCGSLAKLFIYLLVKTWITPTNKYLTDQKVKKVKKKPFLQLNQRSVESFSLKLNHCPKWKFCKTLNKRKESPKWAYFVEPLVIWWNVAAILGIVKYFRQIGEYITNIMTKLNQARYLPKTHTKWELNQEYRCQMMSDHNIGVFSFFF